MRNQVVTWCSGLILYASVFSKHLQVAAGQGSGRLGAAGAPHPLYETLHVAHRYVNVGGCQRYFLLMRNCLHLAYFTGMNGYWQTHGGSSVQTRGREEAMVGATLVVALLA